MRNKNNRTALDLAKMYTGNNPENETVKYKKAAEDKLVAQSLWTLHHHHIPNNYGLSLETENNDMGFPKADDNENLSIKSKNNFNNLNLKNRIG